MLRNFLAPIPLFVIPCSRQSKSSSLVQFAGTWNAGCRGLRSYRLHSLIMRTRCLTRSKRSHVPVCSAPAPRLTRSNRNIPVRGRYGKFGIALLDSGRRFWIVDRGTEQWRKQEGTGIPAEQFLHHCANWAGKQIIDGGGGGGGGVD